MLFTKRDIAKIILPLIVEQLLSVTIGMFDSIMVSQAGEAAISGVSLVDTINLLLTYLFTALATGGAVVISQRLGSNNNHKAKHDSKQLILTVFVMSTLVSVVTVLFRSPLLKLIFGQIESDVMANAQVYFLITAISYPFLGLYSAAAAIFRSYGNSKVSMFASLCMNIINISGNALLIFVFKWGAAGAAIATLAARMFGTVLMLFLLVRKKSPIRLQGLFRIKPDFSVIKSICRIGIPSGLENCMFQLGKVMTQSLISTFGTAQIAANAVANTLSTLQFIPASAINIAVITIVGRCIGANNQKEAVYNSRKLLGLAYAAITLASVLIIGFLNPILSIYDLSSASIDVARTLMILHSIFVCTIWPLSFSIPCSFRAAGDVRFPLVVSIITMWSCRVGLSYVFGKYLELGVLGIWLAMFSDWVCRAVFFVIHYLKGTWLKNRKSVT